MGCDLGPTSSQSVLMTVHVPRRATREGSPTVTMVRTLMDVLVESALQSRSQGECFVLARPYWTSLYPYNADTANLEWRPCGAVGGCKTGNASEGFPSFPRWWSWESWGSGGWTPWYSQGPKACPSPSNFSSKVGMEGSAVSSATRSGMVAKISSRVIGSGACNLFSSFFFF